MDDNLWRRPAGSVAGAPSPNGTPVALTPTYVPPPKMAPPPPGADSGPLLAAPPLPATPPAQDHAAIDAVEERARRTTLVIALSAAGLGVLLLLMTFVRLLASASAAS